MTKNFIMLGTQRTGSSAIAKLINLHKNILSGLEWTQKVTRTEKVIAAKELLSGNFELLKGFNKDYVQKKNPEQIDWIGFKILFSSSNKWIFHPKFSIALWVDQLNSHIDWLKNNPDIHIIHIVRTDNLEWLKSIYLAKETNSYSGKKYPDSIKIDINIKNAMARIKSKNFIDNQLESLERTNPYCQVTYEEFQKNKQKTAQKLIHFLNCDNEINYHNFDAVQQSKGGAKKYIKNYSQLLNALEQRNLIYHGSGETQK